MLAKSKLNSIESLMSQALIDLDVSHKEFKTTVGEKEKYGQIKRVLEIKKREVSLVKINRFEKINFFCFFILYM